MRRLPELRRSGTIEFGIRNTRWSTGVDLFTGWYWVSATFVDRHGERWRWETRISEELVRDWSGLNLALLPRLIWREFKCEMDGRYDRRDAFWPSGPCAGWNRWLGAPREFGHVS